LNRRARTHIRQEVQKSSHGCDLIEADDKTAEKEVKIVAKEVVGGAPSLAETGAALDAEPESN
jgi:hypothetical protein